VTDSTSPPLHPILSEPADLKREFTRRKNLYVTKSVNKDLVEEFMSEGWEFDRKLKVKIRLKKLKPIDERLENRVWMLSYLLGYPEMNQGRKFKIQIRRKGGNIGDKQIDVFAKDDETVVVAECKASNKLRKRSLQQDIEEFANLKGPIANSVNEHYGKKFKPKIVWLIVTENIIWSTPDKERAAGENIRIITERELRYYFQIATHLGTAARYQFLGEFLKNQKIPGLKDTLVPAVRGKLGGRKFYSFIATPKQLLKICFVNHRSLNDPEGAPTYQRLISRPRLRQIGKFLENGGFFPTNILVNFIKPVEFDTVKKDSQTGVTYGHLHLPDRYKSTWVIDGQHRLYSYSHLSEEYQTQNLAVIAFEGMAHGEEADLFVTVNHEQKQIPRTLLDDLEGELKWGSEVPSQRIGAISARLVNVLNSDISEPFYNRVSQQGITTTEKTCLTVPALKNGLRRSGLVGQTVIKQKIYEPGPLSGETDSLTLDRSRSALNLFFNTMRDTNFGQWEKGRAGFLCTNVAIQGYLMLLAALIRYMEMKKGLDSKELEPEQVIMEIEDYSKPVLEFLANATDLAMEKEFKVQFGSGGPREYYFRLCRLIKKKHSDFSPEGMKDWEAEQSEEKIELADRKLKDLNIRVQAYLFRIMAELYGKDYFEKAVPDHDVRTKAYRKSLQDATDRRVPLENYLDFIEYKKISEKSHHWPHLKSVFDIPEKGEKGISKNVRWMDQVNALRRIPAHATEKRKYKLEDFDYIDWIHEEFTRREAAALESPDEGDEHITAADD